MKNKLSKQEKIIINGLFKEYDSWYKNLSSKELYLLKKYTYNSFDYKKPNRFFERLNKNLRGEYDGKDKKKLLQYAEIISTAINKHSLEQTIVCYRRVDNDILKNVKVGTIFQFSQFISTSVVKKCALKKKYTYIIIAHVGTKGAFLEKISAFTGQYEFLLDKGCKYRLLSKEKKIVILEVVI